MRIETENENRFVDYDAFVDEFEFGFVVEEFDLRYSADPEVQVCGVFVPW